MRAGEWCFCIVCGMRIPTRWNENLRIWQFKRMTRVFNDVECDGYCSDNCRQEKRLKDLREDELRKMNERGKQ